MAPFFRGGERRFSYPGEALDLPGRCLGFSLRQK